METPPDTKPSSFGFFQKHAVRVSALLAALGVALGAFGAHGLKPVLSAHPDGVNNWRTAVLYHLIHAVAMFALASRGERTKANALAWWLFLAGVCCFSGSLYLLTTLRWKFLGPVTPLGGLMMIAGWIVLAFPRKDNS